MDPTRPRLSDRLDEPDARPYFLWDSELTVGQLRERLAHGPEEEKLLWIGRILREARYPDVWRFVTLGDVLSRWDRLRGRLGRMNGFWEFLIRTWRENGLIER